MAEVFLKNWLKKIKLNENFISTVLGALVVIVVGVLVLNYFRGLKKESATQANIESAEFEVEANQELPTTYQVKAGENLWQIAVKFYNSGYNWVDIARENGLANPDLIQAGQALNIPKVTVIQPEMAQKGDFGESISDDKYTVVKGDHLWGIAVRAYGDGFQWVKIASENNLTNPDLIHPGNVFTLPR